MTDKDIKVAIIGSGGSSISKASIMLALCNTNMMVVDDSEFDIQLHAISHELPNPKQLYHYQNQLNIPESNQASAHQSRSGKHKSKSKHASPYGI